MTSVDAVGAAAGGGWPVMAALIRNVEWSVDGEAAGVGLDGYGLGVYACGGAGGGRLAYDGALGG